MNKLRVHRTNLNLSQHELAMASQCPRWRIQLIEQNILEPSKGDREALSAVLGSSEAEIFGNPLNLEDKKAP